MNNQILVIMQGHSGAGKSTLARQLASIIDAEIFSTDDLFLIDGVYKFDATKLGFNHKKNQLRACAAMKAGKNVIIDNSNTKAWEAAPYVKAAIDLGISVKFLRAEGNFQNVHGVPADKVEAMKARLEPLSIEACLKAVR